MKLGHIAFRNIMRNKRRSLLSGSAIAVATMSIVLLFSMMEGMVDDMVRNEKLFHTGSIIIRNAQFVENERLNPSHLVVRGASAKVAELEKYPWVSALSERINFAGRVYVNDKELNVMGKGVDFEREKDFQGLDDYLAAGRYPEPGSREALVAYKLADKMGIDLTDGEADKITILTTKANRQSKHFTLEVVGIMALPVGALNSTTLYMPLDTTQELLLMEDALSEILILNDEKMMGDIEAAAQLNEEWAPGHPELAVQSLHDINMIIGLMSVAGNIYSVFAMFFFILGSSVIINTTIMVILERMREIGTMGAMGMKGSELTRLFFLEAFFISAMGAFLGVVLGIIITAVAGKTGIPLGSMVEGLEGFSISNYLYLKLSPKSTVYVFLYSVTVASLATFIPSRKASRIEPVEALRAI